ncbi:hypothetical protein BWQ96_04523 [Gracilariopsis chorda]|uniref:Uncharacterized protein n=1 Tax=Gracilariopsis chorda TaxID=448386 RepID=A0A2V3IUH4_9FLOR|nr:hypothetical protein BWQ96_04523 [Gracilariopsis chorda]|eukprot:PXF45755.1 hypothetical protein BWQ96_04523 [Gracilariopsis chorda]
MGLVLVLVLTRGRRRRSRAVFCGGALTRSCVERCLRVTYNLPHCAAAPPAPTVIALRAWKSIGLLQFTRETTPACFACTADAASLLLMPMSPPSFHTEPFAKCFTFVREISIPPALPPAGAPPICAGNILASLTISRMLLQLNPLR